ncbi:MAG: YbjN domain-containing protein [Trueperaceae bacterium]|nr:YbjN domain-containing protein [Trueperaceae bacterium]MCW5819666.1 YbjN domain-containing protein [Trueperaceae bacterium]
MADVLTGAISASDVSNSFLQAVFAVAQYRTTIDEDGDVVVHGDGLQVWVLLDQPSHRLRFFAAFALKEDTAHADVLQAVNDFNEAYAVARAYTVRRGPGARGVFFDSDITYGGGLIPINMLTRFRIFENILKSEHPVRRLLA